MPRKTNAIQEDTMGRFEGKVAVGGRVVVPAAESAPRC